MEEEKIIQHTKAAYKALVKPRHSFFHRLQEVLIEILIIVFAISISIWFHNWSDSLHQRKEEKEFLTGLREDLKNDLQNLMRSRDFYRDMVKGMTYLQKIGAGKEIDRDSLIEYSGVFFGSTDLDPHISRYEGLKASGKFGIIENKKLLNDMINLHEATFQRIGRLNSIYYQYMERLSAFVEAKARLTPSGTVSNAKDVLLMPQMRILLSLSCNITSNTILPSHEDALNKCQEIIRQIDSQNLDH